MFTASSDDDLIAKLVEALGEAASNSRSAASDEDGVASEFHAMAPAEILRERGFEVSKLKG
jgi:hypothetical protein